ncbi:MAG: hypothetical protein RI893_803, partial [Pseudomonadota bacterium]
TVLRSILGSKSLLGEVITSTAQELMPR